MDLQKQLSDLRERYDQWEKCCHWLDNHPNDPPQRWEKVDLEIKLIGKQVEAVAVIARMSCTDVLKAMGLEV